MLIATFNETTGWAGKTITYDDEQFVLEGHGSVSPKNIMKYDEKGQLTWATDGARSWVGSRASNGTLTSSPDTQLSDSLTTIGRNLYDEIPSDTKKVYDAIRGFRSIDALIVGSNHQCLVALPDSCIIVKPSLMLSYRASYIAFPYAEIESVQEYKWGWSQIIEARTAAYDAQADASGHADPTKRPDCFEGGPRSQAKLAAFAHELRRRTNLLNTVAGVTAVLRGCDVLGGHGLPLASGSVQDLFFGAEELALRDCVEGRVRVRVPYSSIQILDVGGPGAQQTGGGFVGGGFGLEGAATGMLVGTALSLLTTRTKIDTVICLRTDRSEIYFRTGKHTPDAVQMRLSKVFQALRQLDADRAPALSTSQGSAPDTSLADEIAKLAELYAQGSITDEEFAAFKAKLME